MQQQKRKQLAPELKPLALGAVLDTTCLRCGGRGHLSTGKWKVLGDAQVFVECYSTSSKQYEFIDSPSESEDTG
jgi:hypothetical protein